MFITIHDKKEINVEGIYTNRNCKPLMDITAGVIYASFSEAASVLEVATPTVSLDVKNGHKCQGHKLCTLSEILEHADEIAEELAYKQKTINTQSETIQSLEETIRTQEAVIAEYHALLAEQEAKRAAKAELERRKAEYEAKRQELEAEARMLQELEESLKEEI